MAILDGLRPFQRLYNGVQIQLRRDDWPADVPLPEGSTIVGIGENHEEPVHPYWRFIIEPDRTVEFIAGWFVIPPALDEAIIWYQTEMAKLGWVELAEKGYRMAESAAVHFQHPATNARVVVGLRTWTDLEETRAMIRRAVEYPWPERPSVEAELPRPREAEVLLSREVEVPVAA